MPYITQKQREEICLNGGNPTNAGELNYCFTMLAIEYLKEKGESYQTINDIVGALEGAKAEFQRRIVAPYEDRKIWMNGDVYGDA